MKFARSMCVALLLVGAPAFAGSNSNATISQINAWNEFGEVVIQLTGASDYIWFDATTNQGKLMLSIINSAYLSGRTIEISWGTTTSSVLGTSAYKLGAVKLK